MADQRLLSAELLRVLGFAPDLPRGAVLERVHQDSLKFSRQLVGLLLFAVELGDVASVEALADQAQKRLDDVNAVLAQAKEDLAKARQAIETADADAAEVTAKARTEADTLTEEARTAAAWLLREAEDVKRAAQQEATRITAQAESAAAAHVDKVKGDHAELEAAIAAKTSEHAALESKVTDKRRALDELRQRAARLTGD